MQLLTTVLLTILNVIVSCLNSGKTIAIISSNASSRCWAYCYFAAEAAVRFFLLVLASSSIKTQVRVKNYYQKTKLFEHFHSF